MKKVISYNLGENILFDKIGYGENILILYYDTTNHQQIFKNFLHQAAPENSLFLYLAHTSNKLCFDFTVRNHYFNVITEDVILEIKRQLDKSFQEREKTNKEMVLISDWSKANVSDCPIFLPFLEELIKKSRGLSPAGWKRKYRDVKTKTPFLLVNALEISNLKEDFLQQLISLHQRVFLLQDNQHTFQLPTLSPSLETIFPKHHVLPQKQLEKLVKDNLELITLLFLERGNKSGYQVLKEIAQHFHCILSQGTLYPLLYQLEKTNGVKKQNGKGREVIYSLTPETKEQLQSKKETCLMAYQHLASFFDFQRVVNQGGGAAVKNVNIRI